MAQRHAYSQPIETYSLAPHNRNIWPSATRTANQYKHMAQRRIIETYGHTIAGRWSFVTPTRFFCVSIGSIPTTTQALSLGRHCSIALSMTLCFNSAHTTMRHSFNSSMFVSLSGRRVPVLDPKFCAALQYCRGYVEKIY